jgi:hypothetical protein
MVGVLFDKVFEPSPLAIFQTEKADYFDRLLQILEQFDALCGEGKPFCARHVKALIMLDHDRVANNHHREHDE